MTTEKSIQQLEAEVRKALLHRNQANQVFEATQRRAVEAEKALSEQAQQCLDAGDAYDAAVQAHAAALLELDAARAKQWAAD